MTRDWFCIWAVTSENKSSDMCDQRRFRSACTVWSKSSLGAFWIAKDAKFPHAENQRLWSDCADAVFLTDKCAQWRFRSHWALAQSDQNLHCLTGRICNGQGCKVSSLGQRSLWSDCTNVQADVSVLRAQNLRFLPSLPLWGFLSMWETSVSHDHADPSNNSLKGGRRRIHQEPVNVG